MRRIELTPGGIATLACLLEVTAPKPGNVHRGADFEDVTFVDFATSAVVLGQVIQAYADLPLGETVLRAVEETRATVGTNTNLGMVLLIVPLAKVARANPGEQLSTDLVRSYLATLSNRDAANVFEAIRVARPGGLGNSIHMDVNSQADDEVDLLEAMKIAAERDSVARQYATGFCDVIHDYLDRIVLCRRKSGNLIQGLVIAHVVSLSRELDSLIVRKCGQEVAMHAQMMANRALELLTPDWTGPGAHQGDVESFWNAVADLDFWLRSDGHRRNPGTTADLIAASLFVGIHNGTIEPPYR